MSSRSVFCVAFSLAILGSIFVVRGGTSESSQPRVSSKLASPEVSLPHIRPVKKYAAPSASSELGSAIMAGALVVGLFFRQKVRVASV